MNSDRFVIDTNVLISAVVFKSKNPAEAVKRCFLLGKVVLSAEVVAEYRARLLSEKFNPFVSDEIREEALMLFIDNCEIIEPEKAIVVSRDANDNKFLDLARSSKASCIITGDKDLLVLNPFENIPIITPKEFLDRF
jgi:putative PIN family toxin of toxin-antitoxin system